MRGDAVHRRRHAVLAHALMDIAAGIVAGPDFLQILGAACCSTVSNRPSRRPARGQPGSARRAPSPDAWRVAILALDLRNSSQTAASAWSTAAGNSRRWRRWNSPRLSSGRARNRAFPRLAHFGAARPRRAPSRQHVVGDDKRRIFPAEPFARSGDLGCAERAPMRCRGAGLGRRAKRDHGAAGDQARPVAVVRALDRGGDRGGVVAVDALGVPAMRAKAHDLVVGDREAGRPVDRDRVVVVKARSIC